ncbi:MAG: hypothetical protein HUU16_09560 [Candidatus Omnitrophica bacterium]|nr:hypothetical protein [Candidatus Omnitrophota bacterium]
MGADLLMRRVNGRALRHGFLGRASFMGLALALGLALVGLSGCQLPKVQQEYCAPAQPSATHSIGATLLDSPPSLKASQSPETPGFLRVNHQQHAVEQGIACTDCHAIGSGGKPGMPDHDVCSTCHEINIDEPNEDCALCHVLSEQQKQAQAWADISVEHPKKADTFQFDHTAFAADADSCVGCHKTATTSTLTTDSIGGNHATLFPEIRKRGMSTDNCAICHATLNRQTPPDWHRRPDFQEVHGRETQRINNGDCAICHTEQQCRSCHQQTQPKSHQRPEWRHSHGKVGMFDEKACMMCHTEQSCRSCHNTEMPRDHTNFFRTRSHGKIASWNRERCLVCHKQDYCESCHVGSAPRLTPQPFHNAGAPCLSCHSPTSPVAPLRRHGPLPEDSCLRCHRM